jgi:hypothetical protein
MDLMFKGRCSSRRSCGVVPHVSTTEAGFTSATVTLYYFT